MSNINHLFQEIILMAAHWIEILTIFKYLLKFVTNKLRKSFIRQISDSIKLLAYSFSEIIDFRVNKGMFKCRPSL